jgi:hypothetical protein
MKKIYPILFLAFASNSAFCQIGAGVISQYYFTGNANDMVGSNNGIVHGATLAPDRFGNANAAYCYDGIDDHINLGTSTTLKTGTMSISLWAKISSYSTSVGGNYQNQPFITTRASSLPGTYEAYFMGMYITGSNLDAATSSTTGTQNAILSTTTVSINVWNHLVYIFRSDSTWLYVNGVFAQKVYKGFTSGYLAGDSVLLGYVGDVTNSSFARLNGCLDDIRIYNRKLSQADITALYNEPNTVGIKNYETDKVFGIYPNPATNRLRIKTDESDFTVSITNALGQKVYTVSSKTLDEHQSEIDLSALQKGIYFVELEKMNTKTIKKLIVQ